MTSESEGNQNQMQNNHGDDDPGPDSEPHDQLLGVRIQDPSPTPIIIPGVGDYQRSVPRFSVSSIPITYSWSNINVWVGGKIGQGPHVSPNKEVSDKNTGGSKEENRRILNNVSGVLRPGELVAIMGASGAGKSTLLDTLSFRNGRKVKVSGIRAINGRVVEKNKITAISAYVQQTDLFFGVLTVREHLTFQSLVRMHTRIPRKDRMSRVEEVIQQFGLAGCASTQIGTKWFKGISGGEMKRLAIATEVLTDPMFMCCDEPTSGLDSSNAQLVISILKELASSGKTITCTVHQPSSQLFTLFDKVLLIAEGRIAFLGKTVDALQFFNTQGFPCPPMFNPADFLIDTLAIKNGEESRVAVRKICDAFEDASLVNKDVTVDTDTGEDIELQDWEDTLNNTEKGQAHIKPRSRYKSSWMKQFCAVLPRSWITYVRDPMILRMRLAQTIILALFAGTIFYQLDFDSFTGIQNLNGAVFMLLCCLTYQDVIGPLDNFCSELPVFLREHYNGMYRTDVYFLSKIIVEIPFYIFFPTLLTGICYFMIGFYPDWYSFLRTVLIMILVGNICSGVGNLLSCIASTVTVALLLVPIAIFPFFLFGGFLLRPGTGPVFLVWIEKISWFFYGYESLAIVQLENLDVIHCPFGNGTCPETGLAVLQTLGFEPDNFWYDIGALSVLAAASHILAFLALLTRTYVNAS